MPEDHSYGSIRRKNEWDAKKCIHGEPTESQITPDHDLGKSNRFGYRN